MPEIGNDIDAWAQANNIHPSIVEFMKATKSIEPITFHPNYLPNKASMDKVNKIIREG